MKPAIPNLTRLKWVDSTFLFSCFSNSTCDAATHTPKRTTKTYCYKVKYVIVANNKFKVLSEIYKSFQSHCVS